jgi:hypothetical protein
MNRVKEVSPLEDYLLKLVFSNGEERYFDMKPYLNRGIFAVLRDINLFKAVKPTHGTIEWPGEIDMCPDTLYANSVPCGVSPTPLLLLDTFENL